MQYLASVNSAAQLAAILDATPTAVIVVDAGGIIVLVNTEGERLFGYPSAELLGSGVERLLPARFRAAHPGLRGQFMHAPTARPMGAGRDLFGLRKDGSEFPMEIGLSPLQTEHGMLIVSAIVDISERRRHEARFRAAVESAPVAMVMIDQSGQIMLANTEMQRLFGVSDSELLRQSIEILIPERFRAAHPGMRNQFFHQPSSRRMGEGRELFARRRDGSEFPVEIGLNPIQTSEGTFVLAAIIDLSERRQAEQALHQSEERYRSVVESSSDAIITQTLEGRITGWNQGASQLFGYTAEQIVGQTLQALIPAAAQDSEQQSLQAIIQGRAVNGHETLLQHQDGRVLDVSSSLAPLHDSRGKVIGICRIVRDISAQRRARNAMQHALEEKTALLHEVHHRVKNNLQIVSSLLNLQTRRSSPEVQRALIESQSRIKAMALVHQLLYESSSMAEINLAEYLEQLLALIATTYGASSQGIALSFHAEDRAIKLNIQRAIPCGLVINELIVNAIKHAFPAQHKGQIRVLLSRSAAGLACITVSDDGVGLAADFSWQGPGGLGKQLIPMFVAQLRGELQHGSAGPGARFLIEFNPDTPEDDHAGGTDTHR